MTRKQRFWVAFWMLWLYVMAFSNGYVFGVRRTTRAFVEALKGQP